MKGLAPLDDDSAVGPCCPIRDKLPVIREGLRAVRICPAFQNSLIVARALIQLGVSGVIVDWAAQVGLDPRLPDRAGRSSIRASRTIRDRRIWTTQADVSRIASPLALTAPQPLIRHVTYVAGVAGCPRVCGFPSLSLLSAARARWRTGYAVAAPPAGLALAAGFVADPWWFELVRNEVAIQCPIRVRGPVEDVRDVVPTPPRLGG